MGSRNINANFLIRFFFTDIQNKIDIIDIIFSTQFKFKSMLGLSALKSNVYQIL